MRRASQRILAVPFASILLTGCAMSDANREQSTSDVTKVEEYLKEKHAGKKWQTGPARIDTAEVRAAYGGLRFYFVFSPPPVPPRGGAPPGPEVLDEFRKAQAQFEKNNVSLTVALDQKGGVSVYQKAEDFNQGLLKIVDEADAKTATAAVLSLFVGDELGPKTVAAKDVIAQKDAKGRWSGSITIGTAGSGGWSATVQFDQAGSCLAVARNPLALNVP